MQLVSKNKSINKEFNSIIVPVYNSRETLSELVARVSEVMSRSEIDYELVMIDDGSCDDSFTEISRLAAEYPSVKGFRLSKNFGHQAALLIGLQKSQGKYVAIIDDDLQDPPELIPVMFSKLDEGSDVAYGVRRKRKEHIIKRFLFSGFYKVLSVFSKIEIPHDAGDFCVMKRCVVDAMLSMYDANPFLRGLRAWVGYQQIGVEYDRSARLQGASGYSLRKYISLATSGILMFSNLPLRLTSYLGIFSSFISIIFATITLGVWMIKPFDVPGYLSIIVLVTFMGGVQLVSIGIIGEYLARTLENTRQWPVAFVAESTEKEIL